MSPGGNKVGAKILQALEKEDVLGDTPHPDAEEAAQYHDLHQYTYLPDSKVFGISGKAFDLIHRYSIPPDPISYAVWFTYAANSNALLKQKVDNQLESRGAISRQDIALIYKSFLEDSYIVDSQQNLGLELETNLSDISGVMDSCSEAYKQYSASLYDAKARLTQAATAEAVNAIAADMLQQSDRVSKATASLQADLEESRAHIEYLNQQLEDLQNLSVRDPLTSASNRRAFDIRLKKEIETAESTGAHLCIAFADLDHFKRVNDQLGHQIGDVVLKHFASILLSGVPEGSMVARYGGEEFAIILPGISKIDAHNLAVKLCYQFAEEKFLADTQHEVLGALTASFGLAFYQPGRGSYKLLETADEKLYEAKSAGRNCVRTETIN